MSTSAAGAACAGLVRIYWTGTGAVHALRGVDLDLPPGTITAVVGPSGSGKSSLLRLLACIDPPSAGEVWLAGRPTAALAGPHRRQLRRRSIGYVFQRPADNLVPYLTTLEHLKLAAGLRDVPHSSAIASADELLDALGLAERAKRRPVELSGGEQQRLALAAAVIGGPALVVADEPTAELDSPSAEALMAAVRALADGGATFVIATHDTEVRAASDRTVTLRHGALEAVDERGVSGGALAVVDRDGRVQLPPEAVRLFPGG